jgi:transketolase
MTSSPSLGIARLQVDPERAAAWRAFRQQIAASPDGAADALLADRARASRRQIVTTIATAGMGHVGGDLSVTDLLTVLFNSVLAVDPATPDDPGRDRFILSKGHCAVALYTTLASCGFFAESELGTFMRPLSALSGHPNRNYVPGVETNTGPLGHGLPVAVGCAIGARISGRSYRVVCVLGDGELQEGSNWEAFMCAGHQRLAHLYAVVDRNTLQQGDRTEATNSLEPLAGKLEAFGWEVREIDGHDIAQIRAVFAPSTSGRPVAIVARTVKGKGVSFMEDGVAWHHRVPSADETARALGELA